MIFGKTNDQRLKVHPWFAWRPVRLIHDGRRVFWQWIYRQRSVHNIGDGYMVRQNYYLKKPEQHPSKENSLIIERNIEMARAAAAELSLEVILDAYKATQVHGGGHPDIRQKLDDALGNEVYIQRLKQDKQRR